MDKPVTWSGAAYSFSGAGAYLGVAWCDEHHSVAQILMPRQGWVYAGGATRVRETDDSPIVYFAVRDPSAVRVIPVSDRRNRGQRHVLLAFQPAKASRKPEELEPPVMSLLKKHCEQQRVGVFVVTVGLAIDEETRFFHSVVKNHEGRAYGELCQNVEQYRIGPSA